MCYDLRFYLQDPLGTVRLLAQFLGVPAPPELCAQIADACGFQKMKEANDAKQLPEWMSSLGNFNSHMYRKGETFETEQIVWLKIFGGFLLPLQMLYQEMCLHLN